MSAPPTPAGRVLRAVLKTELRSLLRDRRAIFSALVLPTLLYPVLFFGQGKLKQVARESLEAKEVTIAHDLSGAPERVAIRVIELLEEETPIVLQELPAGSCSALEGVVQEGTEASAQRERELALDRMGSGVDLLLYAVPDPVTVRGTLFRLHFDGADDTPQEAEDRVREALSKLETELRDERIGELLGADPAAALRVESRDLASEEDLGGAMLGRLLPLIAVLVLLSGGSYAALAAFAGERESGTLETLLVQPVESGALVRGKFLAVLFTGLVTLALNLGSLFATFSLGLGSLGGLEGDVSGPGLERIATAGLIFLPVCLLLCALLCATCGRARSFREGQHYVLPLSLLCMAPSALALQPEVELDLFLACLPLAGPSLAFREAMVGQLGFLPGLFAFVSTTLYAGLALRYLGSLLDAEKVLAGGSSKAEAVLRRVQSRQALAFGFAGVLGVYLVGGLVQSWHPAWGLAATLWIVLPLLAFWSASGTARRAGESIPAALQLRVPSALHVLGALLLAPSLARLAVHWITWQQRVLPLPSSMTEAGGFPAEITTLPPLLFLLLLALSPGICEELFFRGAILSGMRRDFAAWKVVLWQAILFGAVHASIYRFAPTAALGALLAMITLRSRSLWPAVLLHVGYNACVVIASDEARFGEWFGEWFAAWWVPWLVLPGLGLFGVRRRSRVSRDRAAPREVREA